MQPTATSDSDATGTSGDPRAFWRALLYRWFVEYNPSYLLSAAFVFGGCFLWSRGVVHEATLTSTLGIPLVAEIYAAALVGGAALLTRIGQRRPAVMLALVFLVYQWDTTLHTEACAYLGWVGAWASAAWLAIFVGKLWAMGWAMRIRIARRMVAALVIGALGLAVFPRVFPLCGARAMGALFAAWIFTLVSLRKGGEIACMGQLDAWGVTVLRRATDAAWLISAAMISLHAAMWCANAEVSLAPVLFALPLLAVRRIRSEARTWAVVTLTLALAAALVPAAFFATSLLTASALLVRILAPQFARVANVRAAPAERIPVPYRASRGPYYEARVTIEHTPAAPLDAGETARAWSGALFATYLGVWTLHWSHGAWPGHLVWLDTGFAIVTAVAIWRSHAWATFGLPLAVTCVEFVVEARLVPLPRSSAGWGAGAIVLGFALLGVSLLVSYRLREFGPAKRRVDSA